MEESSNKNEDDRYDVFIYQWIVEDVRDYDDEGRMVRYIEVSGYGIDTENKNVYVQLERGTFKPWLSLKLHDKYCHNDNELVRDLKKMYATKLTMSESDKYEENTIYLEKTNIKKKLYFYSTEEDMKVYRVYFPSNAQRRQFFYKKKDDDYKPYSVNESETNITLQFLNENSLPSCGWVTLHDVLRYPTRPYTKVTRGNSCFECVVSPYQIKIKENQEEHPLPKFRCMSFDLECYSDVVSKFPNATIESNCIFQIGVVTKDENDEEKRYIFTLMPKERSFHLNDVIVRRYESENELLNGFLYFMSDEFNCHLILGYNIFGFDIPYLKERCDRYGIEMGSEDDRMIDYRTIKKSSGPVLHTAFKSFTSMITMGEL